MNDENKPQGNSDWLQAYGLDLEDKVLCDSKGCEGEAVYYSQASCCSAIILACENCMHSAAKMLVWLHHNERSVTCDACNRETDPKGWLSKPQRLRLTQAG